MAIKYVCCQCDVDMTAAVHSACDSYINTATLVFRGLEFEHSTASVVTLTCKNGHTCNYPCSGIQQ